MAGTLVDGNSSCDSEKLGSGFVVSVQKFVMHAAFLKSPEAGFLKIDLDLGTT